MRYTVTMKIDARLDIETEADSPEEAFGNAIAGFLDADLSKIEMIDWKPVKTENENGESTDYDRD